VTLVSGDNDPFVRKEYPAGTVVVKQTELIPITAAGHYPMVQKHSRGRGSVESLLTDENGE